MCIRDSRDTDARGDGHLVVAEHHRFGDALLEPFDDGEHSLLLEPVEQHRELVTAEPRCRVDAAQVAVQALTDRLEQLVAHQVTEGVVDQLEAVQVEEHHREPGPVAPLRLLHRPTAACSSPGSAGRWSSRSGATGPGSRWCSSTWTASS